ncbi:MAG: HlyD family efflux transporter periplasmic adaptor subunit [Pirellulales bacterium]|nr:HlyD family efflux transporter periplasmic adaptor subunit [Pirellulales bacterium]
MSRYALAMLLVFVLSWSAVAVAQETAKPNRKKPVAATADKDKAVSEKAGPEKPKPDEAKSEKTSEEKKSDKPESKDAKPEAAKPAEAKPAEPAKPETCEAKREPLRIDVEVKGTFEPRRVTSISLRMKQWSTLTVLKAVEHGARVEQGDLLVALDLDKIDEAIADLQAQIRLADIDLERGRQELAAMKKLAPMDLAATARNERILREDFDRFMKIELPTARESADFYLKMAADNLAYEREELDQLEKMYKADDLTEETEEIVLRRAKDSVERAEHSYKLSKLRHEQAVKFGLPREEQSVKDSFERDKIALAQAKILLPMGLKRQQWTMRKTEVERARADEKLKELLADRAAMTIKAPVDGVVYYGKWVDGAWSGATTSDQLARGTTLQADKVFMTIVQTRPLRIRAEIAEKDLQYVHAGLKGVAHPTAFSDRKLQAVVADVAEVPSAGGSFGATLTLAGGDVKALAPGMTCAVTLPGYVNPKALVVPPTAVGTEPLDREKHFVYRVGKDDKPVKRPVELGKRTDKGVEILKGLAEGDKILRDASKTPEDKPADKKAEKTEKTKKTKPAKKTKKAPKD